MTLRDLAKRHGLALIYGATVLVALVVRWRFAVDEHPPELYLVHDMLRYQAQGEAVLTRAREPWDTFTPIGYPLFLALVGDVKRVGAVQAVLGAITAGLTAWLAYRLDRSKISAAIAGLLCAFYAPLVLYTGFVLTETLCAFLLVLAMVLVISGVERRHRALAAMGGVVLGGAALVRPSLLPFLALLVWPTVVLFKGGKRELAWTLGGAFLVLLPVAIHTSSVLGRPAVVASNGGVNFFLAHADCRSVRSNASGAVVEVSTHYSRAHLAGRCYSDAALLDERHFYARGVAEITSHPSRLLRAFHALAEGLGIAPSRAFPDQPFWPGSMDHEDTLNAFSRSFAWLLLLPAIAHAAARIRRREERDLARWLMWLLVGSVLFVLYAFNGNPRVRVSSDPIIMALAVSAFLSLRRVVRKKSA